MVQVRLNGQEQFAIQARYALRTMLDILGVEYGLQFPSPGPDSVEIQVATGGGLRVLVDGCRSQQTEKSNLEGTIRLQLSGWTGEEIKVRFV